MRIAICEDEAVYTEDLKQYIQMYFNHHKISVQTDEFWSAKEMAASDASYDILFTDIYMPDMDGIELFRTLRSQGKQFPIVFTTVSLNHAIDAFALGALHYLVKPVTYEQTAQALDRCMESLKKEPGKILEIKNGAAMIPIPQDNILYIEVQDKLCTIHTQKNQYQTYTSLDSVFEALDSGDFMKAQRSYLVNMKYIESFQPGKLTLKNGKEIVLSRKNRAELKKQYQSFLFALARKGDL